MGKADLLTHLSHAASEFPLTFRMKFLDIPILCRTNSPHIATFISFYFHPFKTLNDKEFPELDLVFWESPDPKIYQELSEYEVSHEQKQLTDPGLEIRFGMADGFERLIIDESITIVYLRDLGKAYLLSNGFQPLIKNQAVYKGILTLMNEHGRSRSLFFVHAATVAKNGLGISFCAASGVGKTTLAIAMADQGLQIVDDDISILDLRSDKILVHSYSPNLNVTDETVERFERLHILNTLPFGKGLEKRTFRFDEIFHDGWAKSCEAKAMAVLTRSKDKDHHARPISKTKALEKLISQSLFVSDKAASMIHFDGLHRFVQSVRTYHMEVGPDFTGISKLVEDLIFERI